MRKLFLNYLAICTYYSPGVRWGWVEGGWHVDASRRWKRRGSRWVGEEPGFLMRWPRTLLRKGGWVP